MSATIDIERVPVIRNESPDSINPNVREAHFIQHMAKKISIYSIIGLGHIKFNNHIA